MEKGTSILFAFVIWVSLMGMVVNSAYKALKSFQDVQIIHVKSFDEILDGNR